MKLFILTLCVVGAFARPDVSHVLNAARSDQEATIVKQELDVGPDGAYKWAYETDNGIAAHEHGDLKNPNTEQAAEDVGGAFAWTAPDGQKVSVQYTADENGYHPVSDVLPTPPPIPEAILRSLEYIARSAPQRR